MYSKGFIMTISDFGKNKTSKRKGDTLEILVGFTLETLVKGRKIPVNKQQTIMKAIDDYSKKVFPVNKKFDLKFQDGTIKKYNVVPKDDADLIFSKSQIQDGRITLMYRKKKENIQKEFDNAEAVRKYLIEDEFLEKIELPTLLQKFRLDFWRFSSIGNILYIYECKNKEKTYLEKRDINQIQSYAQIIKDSLKDLPEESFGYVTLVVNGPLKNWKEEVDRIKLYYDIEIRVNNIKNWLTRYAKKTGQKIDCLVFSKHRLKKYNFISIKAGKKSELYLNIHLSPYKEHEYYRKVKLLISDDLGRIKRFLDKDIIVLAK